MSSEELVSVIVPIYNVIEYLDDCIQSLIRQTYSNIEIILVDDGSKDGSEKVCDLYQESDKRVKVIHQKNKGLPGARNSGLKISSGKWILFVDGDDWLVENAIEVMLEQIDENVDLVLFDLKKTTIYERNVYEKVYLRKSLNNEEIKWLLNDSFDPMYEKINYIHSKVSACSKLYNANLICKNNLFFYEDVKVHEDIPYAVKVYSKAEKVTYIKATLYRYRYNPVSITNSYRANYPQELEMLITRLENIMYGLEDKTESLRMLNDRKIASAINLLIKCYCHKENRMKYKIRKNEYMSWCKKMGIYDILTDIRITEYSNLKKIVTILVKVNNFWLLNFIVKFYGDFKGKY